MANITTSHVKLLLVQLSEFIRNKLAVEEYAFTVEELQTATQKEREALKPIYPIGVKKGTSFH